MRCPDKIREQLDRTKAEIAAMPHDPRAWARKLRMRELMCERLTRFQRSAWREAIAS